MEIESLQLNSIVQMACRDRCLLMYLYARSERLALALVYSKLMVVGLARIIISTVV